MRADQRGIERRRLRRHEHAAAPTRGRHGHLWALPDGTGLHAPLGTVVEDPATGQLCCHLCGRWFRSLGGHVRAHGYSAAAYREAMSLLRTRPLVSVTLSAGIAQRQRQAYRASAQVRERFAATQEEARSGRLAWRSRAGNRESLQRLERKRTSRAQLDAGRATRARRSADRRAALIAEHGATDLHGYLRDAYAAGGSLESLARTTGLGRARLREELAAAGVTLRPRGQNTAAGKRARASATEAVAAARVGSADVRRWLSEHKEAGWSLSRLAAAVGHSTQWVRWRLDTAPGQASPRAVAR